MCVVGLHRSWCSRESSSCEWLFLLVSHCSEAGSTPELPLCPASLHSACSWPTLVTSPDFVTAVCGFQDREQGHGKRVSSETHPVGGLGGPTCSRPFGQNWSLSPPNLQEAEMTGSFRGRDESTVEDCGNKWGFLVGPKVFFSLCLLLHLRRGPQ